MRNIFVKLSFLSLCLVCLVSSNEYTLVVEKFLNNGDPIMGSPATFTFSNDENPDIVKTSFVVDATDYSEVTRTSIYFANDEKNILKLEFTNDTVTWINYETPYRVKGKKEKTDDDTVDPLLVNDFEVPMDKLPVNVTSVSASIEVKDKDAKPLMLNYYGIKNYIISIQDTMVVESFMRLSFDETPKQ